MTKKQFAILFAAAILLLFTACSAPEDSVPVQEEEEEEIDFSGGSQLGSTQIKWLTLEVGTTVDELRFNWFSPSASVGMVELTNTQTQEVQTIEADCTASVNRENYYVNKAVVTDLLPGAVYTYRVGNEDAWSPEYTYQAPADTGNDFTFLVTADAQLGQSQTEAREVTSLRWNQVLDRITAEVPEAQFLFHLGDHVACFGSGRDYELFLDHLSLYSIPLAPVVGNHDVPNQWSVAESGYPSGPYFYEHLNVPNLSELGQTEAGSMDGNYYFIRGEVLFLILNDECASVSEHTQYAAQITAEHPEVKWRILAQHYPAFSGVESADSADSKDWIVSLAADYGFDLVLTAHDHAYSRTAFLNRDAQALDGYSYESGSTADNPEGVLFITCSTSSGCLYHATTPQDPIVYQGQPEIPMAMRIDVTDTELHITAYLTEEWSVYDEYTIRKD